MFVCSAFLFLPKPKRVSAEKIPKVRTDLQLSMDSKNKVANMQFNPHTRWWDCFVSGDSFVVNAFLRRGMEECERYSATEHKLKNAQVWISFHLRLFTLYSEPYLPQHNFIPIRVFIRSKTSLGFWRSGILEA